VSGLVLRDSVEWCGPDKVVRRSDRMFFIVVVLWCLDLAFRDDASEFGLPEREGLPA
jgi:hypothetical protein